MLKTEKRRCSPSAVRLEALIPRKESNAMKRFVTDSAVVPGAPVGKAARAVSESFDRFCLAAGIEALDAMMEGDAEEACGPRLGRRG